MLGCKLTVGHYTTTYSLQILAVVRSSNADIHAPLVVFTKPDDVYKPQQWHVNIVLEPEFSAIRDVLIVNNPISNLDYILVSCQEGLILTWYAGRSWQSCPLPCLPMAQAVNPGLVRALRDKQDPVAYIVIAEVSSQSCCNKPYLVKNVRSTVGSCTCTQKLKKRMLHFLISFGREVS